MTTWMKMPQPHPRSDRADPAIEWRATPAGRDATGAQLPGRRPRAVGRRWRRAVALASLCVLLTACDGCGEEEAADPVRELGVERDEPVVVEMVLTTPPAESGSASPLEPPVPELADVLRHLDTVRDDDRIRGLLLRLGPFGGAWARADELAAALERVSAAEKPVHCHFELVDNAAYGLLARACDRISMTPAGHLELVGPAAQVFYAKTLLERIGVEAELEQVGRYKGAADPFTRDEMPPESREALGAILDDFHAALVEALGEGRDIDPAEARRIIDDGPYGAGGARDAGLIDDVGFDDEAREHVRQAGEAEHVERARLVPKPESVGITDVLGALAGETSDDDPEGPRIALVRLEGTIVDAERPGMTGARSGPFVRTMRDYADEDDIKAVVLRIDSPGGSALASDRMWHAVRRVAKAKPVIVSIGDMAASGGYYIASAGTTVLADPTSLVGSIGVVGGKVSIGPLAERSGVHVVVLERGENAAWTSPLRSFEEDEERRLERMLERTYDRFLRRVAAGRGMDKSAVKAAAEGRLFSGTQARSLGLVDEHAGLAEALKRAREEGGVAEDAAVERWPPRKTFLDALAGRMGSGQAGLGGSELLLALDARAPATLASATAFAGILSRERVGVVLPYALWLD